MHPIHHKMRYVELTSHLIQMFDGKVDAMIEVGTKKGDHIFLDGGCVAVMVTHNGGNEYWVLRSGNADESSSFNSRLVDLSVKEVTTRYGDIIYKMNEHFAKDKVPVVKEDHYSWEEYLLVHKTIDSWCRGNGYGEGLTIDIGKKAIVDGLEHQEFEFTTDKIKKGEKVFRRCYVVRDVNNNEFQIKLIHEDSRVSTEIVKYDLITLAIKTADRQPSLHPMTIAFNELPLREATRVYHEIMNQMAGSGFGHLIPPLHSQVNNQPYGGFDRQGGFRSPGDMYRR